MARGRSRFTSEGRIAGRPGTGRPCGTSPRRATPRPARPKRGTAAIPATRTRSDTGRFGSTRLPRISRRQRGRAEGEGRGVRLPEVREDVPHPLPEVAVAALEAQELGELRAGEVQGHPGLEAGHDRLGNEAHEAPRAQQPGREAERGDEERGGRREHRVAPRVATGEVPEGRADEQRDRGGHGDGRVPRAAEEPEDEPREETGVQARLGREAGERGVAEAGGQQVGGEHEARDEVPAQPLPPVGPQQPQARHGVPRHDHPPRATATRAPASPRRRAGASRPGSSARGPRR